MPTVADALGREAACSQKPTEVQNFMLRFMSFRSPLGRLNYVLAYGFVLTDLRSRAQRSQN
jgi:hypothetical protein